MGTRLYGLAFGLAAMLAISPGAEAIAQVLTYKNNYGRYDPYQNYYFVLTVWRVGMMIGATALGFLLGWFLSPEARAFRRLILLILAGFGVFVATFHDGALGWGSAFIMSLAGFLAGIGYWLGRVARKLAELPTTFGSSKWATAQHMFERGFFRVSDVSACGTDLRFS